MIHIFHDCHRECSSLLQHSSNSIRNSRTELCTHGGKDFKQNNQLSGANAILASNAWQAERGGGEGGERATVEGTGGKRGGGGDICCKLQVKCEGQHKASGSAALHAY